MGLLAVLVAASAITMSVLGARKADAPTTTTSPRTATSIGVALAPSMGKTQGPADAKVVVVEFADFQ